VPLVLTSRELGNLHQTSDGTLPAGASMMQGVRSTTNRLLDENQAPPPTQEQLLVQTMEELEKGGWEALGGHPMGSNLVIQMLDLFFGVFFFSRGTAQFFSYVQASEDGGGPPLQLESMVSFFALYYTLFGIYAAEHCSLVYPPFDPGIQDSEIGLTLAITSRLIYSWLTTHCLVGVVLCYHFMIMCAGVSSNQRRHLLCVKHPRLMSLPYSVGPMSFILFGVAFFSGRAAEFYRTGATSAQNTAAGISFFFAIGMWFIGAAYGTIAVRESMRPWPEAMSKLEESQGQQSEATQD
jgi:hypothetical protein